MFRHPSCTFYYIEMRDTRALYDANSIVGTIKYMRYNFPRTDIIRKADERQRNEMLNAREERILL